VHLAIAQTLQVIKELKGIDSVRSGVSKGLDIAILGHNDFYSQRAQLEKLELPRRLDSLKKIQPFVPLGVSIEEVHKTGMGSSAALITSLVGALLVHLEAVDPTKFSETDDGGLRLIHNVAQYIHCLAQGKVGSGFDVASAIFGTHVYTRFDPAVITSLMESGVGDDRCR
jgi:phosphomevalonate kinase